MRRALSLLILFSALATLAIWAVDRPGSLILNWQGWRVETSLLVLATGLLILCATVWFISRLWSWMVYGHWFSPGRRQIRRLDAGLETLDRSITALASGDAKTALKLAREATQKLPNSAMAHVLAAQSATLLGDQKAADTHYQALLDSRAGKFIGLRGKILTARRKGERSKAAELLVDAQQSAPKSSWAIEQSFELATEAGDWNEAETSLNRGLKQNVFTPENAQKHRGALTYMRAVDAEAKEEKARALQLALKSHKIRPDFAPATLLAARLLKSAGQTRRAAKSIETTWAHTPHPVLGDLYALLAPTETSAARLQRFQKLAALNPGHRESRLRLAEAALGNGQSDIAEKMLEPLIHGQLTTRVARLMLNLVEVQHKDAHTQTHWADLTTKAIGEPQWCCTHCGSERARWATHCTGCGDFNSLEWDVKNPPINHDRAQDILVNIAIPQALPMN